MTKQKYYPIILPAIGAALLAIVSQIVIPIGPVPVTLQTFAIGLLATILKPREAVLSAIVCLLLGAMGLPVFAGGAGGIQSLFGPTGGYLWGYLPFMLITSLLTSKNSSFLRIFGANLLGDLSLFTIGVLGLHILAKMPWQQAITVGVTPFIIPDVIKLAMISLVSKPLFKALKNEPYFK